MEKGLSFLRVCGACGGIPEGMTLFCPSCRTELETGVSRWRIISEIRCLTLFDVINKDLYYSWLLRLKEESCPRLRNWLSGELLRRRLVLMPYLDPESILIPAPTSTGRRHAHRLVESLSELTGLESMDVLAKNEDSQKNKSLFERRNPEIVLKGKACGKKSVILVDDLVTTGSTAKKCFEVLGRPRKYEVWAPFFRPMQACGSSSRLI